MVVSLTFSDLRYNLVQMKTFNFKKLDAFTIGKSTGNPAGYVYLATGETITESEMLRIAKETQGLVSEVGYLFPGNAEYDYQLRYFSCEKEVPFCGHATVAIMYDLLKNDEQLCRKKTLKIRTKKGISLVENCLAEEDLVYIYAPQPEFIDTLPAVEPTLQALGLDPHQYDAGQKMRLLNVGQNILLVPLAGVDDVINCKPDYQTIRQFALANNIEVLNIYTSQTIFKENQYRTRVFAPAFGYLEDPATGSANAALGYHLASTTGFEKDTLRIEQGPAKNEPNIVIIKKRPDALLIGGQSIARISGRC